MSIQQYVGIHFLGNFAAAYELLLLCIWSMLIASDEAKWVNLKISAWIAWNSPLIFLQTRIICNNDHLKLARIKVLPLLARYICVLTSNNMARAVNIEWLIKGLSTNNDDMYKTNLIIDTRICVCYRRNGSRAIRIYIGQTCILVSTDHRKIPRKTRNTCSYLRKIRCT